MVAVVNAALGVVIVVVVAAAVVMNACDNDRNEIPRRVDTETNAAAAASFGLSMQGGGCEG